MYPVKPLEPYSVQLYSENSSFTVAEGYVKESMWIAALSPQIHITYSLSNTRSSPQIAILVSY
jgi:hypothetical protein